MKIIETAQLKNMEKVKAWSDHIILHFWHCASVCKETEATTDEEALVKLKVHSGAL